MKEKLLKWKNLLRKNTLLKKIYAAIGKAVIASIVVVLLYILKISSYKILNKVDFKTAVDTLITNDISLVSYTIEPIDELDAGQIEIQPQILLCYDNNVILTILCEGDFSSKVYFLEENNKFIIYQTLESKYTNLCKYLSENLGQFYDTTKLSIKEIGFCHITQKKGIIDTDYYFVIDAGKFIRLSTIEADKKKYGLLYSDNDLLGDECEISIQKIISEFKKRVK